jgi:hypothetical protein
MHTFSFYSPNSIPLVWNKSKRPSLTYDAVTASQGSSEHGRVFKEYIKTSAYLVPSAFPRYVIRVLISNSM